MTIEQKELYCFIHGTLEDSFNRISKNCVSPLIAVRQLVNKAIKIYIKDYCTKNDNPFSEEDFQEVVKTLYDEIMLG